MSFLKEALKVAGTLGGAYLGGIPGGIAGRGLTGFLTGEDTDSLIKNSLIFGTGAGGGMNYASPFLEGMPGYGAGSELWSKYMPGFLGGGGPELGSDIAGDMGGRVAGGGGAAAGGGGGAAEGGGGFLSNIGGWAKDNPVLALMGIGIGSDLIAGGKRKEAEQSGLQGYWDEVRAEQAAGQAGKEAEKESLAKYFAETTWNPETRATYQTGISGTYSDLLAGQQRRTAAQGAEAGRGGGFFSNEAKKDQAAVNEAIAKAMGATYQPSTAPLSAYQAQASANTPYTARQTPLSVYAAQASANTPAYIDTLSGAGETAGKLLPYYYMSKLMGRN